MSWIFKIQNTHIRWNSSKLLLKIWSKWRTMGRYFKELNPQLMCIFFRFVTLKSNLLLRYRIAVWQPPLAYVWEKNYGESCNTAIARYCWMCTEWPYSLQIDIFATPGSHKEEDQGTVGTWLLSAWQWISKSTTKRGLQLQWRTPSSVQLFIHVSKIQNEKPFQLRSKCSRKFLVNWSFLNHSFAWRQYGANNLGVLIWFFFWPLDFLFFLLLLRFYSG